MLPLRQRAAAVARRARPTQLRSSRSYASESHGHHHDHHAPAVDEPLGAGFFIAFGALPAGALVYYISRPGKDGEPSSVTKAIQSWSDLGKQWEQRNTLHTAAIEQAAFDKHLYYNAGRNAHIELKYPEMIQAGPDRNVPAGHYANLDNVVAHYRNQHLAEEERKAKKLASTKEA
ncbi:putative nadh-ubiquinone oxidoreductase kda subunit protein [Phaeoacremonium minimum UCRPA7]|uniref:Putative nadh-ubiquinone oxidoreductase kDa subunit protein n=1 Tax=Phaeoacremonium minimum (strain UCR-PA7) TaxID=1286976 RepID=R8BVJ0_PHAM7|nr:putative nadh-ubiquinone oxidoreductase kda subunit protein [Phaeoacremonium minimum UCRPA7]EOO03391.1 putative nadh-ubiquinone oxidoreductase kda subunit protein [Phaeoacremonium minimum UCRPA7]